MKTLGLIGGMTWLSTAEYYRLINEGVSRRLGGINNAKCIVNTLNMAEIADLNGRQDWDAVLEVFADVATHLAQSGAQALVLCANTAHVVADGLEKRIGIPLLHIADATGRAIRAQGLDRVALLGTKYTMELPFFRDRLARHGVIALIPNDAEREYIHQTIFAELGKNVLKKETRDRYLGVIDRMAKEDGIQGAILGCTEIPLLIRQSDTKTPVFDTTALHASDAVEFALS